MSGWPAALDALEEWLRRTAATTLLQEPLPPAPDLPTEPLPGQLALRAQVLLTQLRATDAQLTRTRARLARERAYGTT